LTLFANIYPTMKSDIYIPKGVEGFANNVLENRKRIPGRNQLS
jgi:hypothetical protein